MVEDIRKSWILLSLVGLGALFIAGFCAIFCVIPMNAIPVPDGVRMLILLFVFTFIWAKFMNLMLNVRVEPAALLLTAFIIIFEITFEILVKLAIFDMNVSSEHLAILLGLATVATCCTMKRDERYWKD